MAIQANAQGVVNGRFQIPADVPAGAKQVEFIGAGGSRGTATFVGEGTMQTDVMRTIITTIEVRSGFNPDPLAQTFSLPQATPLGGIKLWFTAKGPSTVLVQIRGVTVGMPNNVVHAEARVLPAAINTTGPTQIAFDAPTWLEGATEYAVVVMCNDAVTKLSVAELGKWDLNAKSWVSSQPYQVGVLLSSSNASTWTAHQDRDMTFELLKAVYTETSRSIELGSVTVDKATDLLLLALAEMPTSDTRVEYALALPGGAVVNVAEGQPVRLSAPISGSVGVTAKLTGKAGASPVLHPGAQLISGAVKTSADYVSAAFPAGPNSRIRVILDAVLPSGSTIAVKVSAAGPGAVESYIDVPLKLPTRQLTHDKFELTYEVTGINADAVKLKLILNGTPSARPEVENLRALAL